MSAAAIVAIGVIVIVFLGAAVLFTAARRNDTARATGSLSRETRSRDKRAEAALPEVETVATGKEVERAVVAARVGGAVEKAPSAAPVVWKPPDPEVIAVSRRQFFNRSIVSLMGVALGGFGLSCIAFLWPSRSGGFGSAINIGKLEDVLAEIRANQGFLYRPEGRAWITEYPVETLSKAEAVYAAPVLEGMRSGVSALYQKCPHLGCRVPECKTSQWFECPCHGSQYNRVGEKKGGPAPRGMDHFAVAISGGEVIVNTGNILTGAAIGTNTTGQEAEGPHCISGGH